MEGPGLDIVEATGELIEGGAALAFTVTVEGIPEEPDLDVPFRIDFLLRDPRIPTYDLRSYRDINRIIRYEQGDERQATILLLAERGISHPSTVQVEDGTVRITVAGRQLQLDEDLGGVDQRPVRWTVVTRMGTVCDRLGDGRATRRLTVAQPTPTTGLTETPSAPPAAVTPTEEGVSSGDFPWSGVAVGLAAGAALILLLVAGMVVRDRVSSRHVPKHQDAPPR